MPETGWGLHALRLEGARQIVAELIRVHGALPAASSPFAWMNVVDESERALRLVLLDSVRLQLSAATDHLAGMSALIAAPVVSRSFFVAVRSVLDALSPAWWILSPGCSLAPVEGTAEVAPVVDLAASKSTAARLLCYLAADVRQYANVLKATTGKVGDPSVAERFERYARWADAVAPGAVVGVPSKANWSVAGARWPGFTAMAGDLAVVLDRPAPSSNPYQFLSAITHVHPTFVMRGATVLSRSAETGVRMVQLSPTPAMIDRWSRYTARAVYAVSLAVLGVHGWSADGIQQWYRGWQLLPEVPE